MQQAAGKVKEGDFAPDFTLPDQSNNPVRLAELVKENIVVLYFYPADFTGGCTLEACSFRDNYEAFTDAGATVVGVSKDSVESHKRFAERHRLPFILLSDEDGAVHNQYGIKPLIFDLFPGRVTFVIDRQRIVRHVFSSRVNFPGHTTDALKTIQALLKNEKA
jgi:peroxiredoxin Q/BCP